MRGGLTSQGHTIGETAIRRRFHALGFSLTANKQRSEGASPADRDAHFQHITGTGNALQAQGTPVISVECKQNELSGNFKNSGSEWQASGQETTVNVYADLSIAAGKAVPSGISALLQKRGFVTLGSDQETAEFAVESSRRWWKRVGSNLYPTSAALLLVAAGGGSNGARNRLWKPPVHHVANAARLAMTVCHLPPATSNWNKIEHRRFSSISINWRGKPLTSLETLIELLAHTTTKEGLTVTAVKDTHSSPTGIKVSDEAMTALKITNHPFHGEWNDTIQPQ